MRLHGVDIGAVEQRPRRCWVVGVDPLDQVVLAHHRLRIALLGRRWPRPLGGDRRRAAAPAPSGGWFRIRGRSVWARGAILALPAAAWNHQPGTSGYHRIARTQGNRQSGSFATFRVRRQRRAAPCKRNGPDWIRALTAATCDDNLRARVLRAPTSISRLRARLGGREAFEALEQLFLGHAPAGNHRVSASTSNRLAAPISGTESGSGSSTSTYFCSVNQFLSCRPAEPSRRRSRAAPPPGSVVVAIDGDRRTRRTCGRGGSPTDEIEPVFDLIDAVFYGDTSQAVAPNMRLFS